MDVALSIVAIMILAGLFVFLRRRPPRDADRTERARESEEVNDARFHAVSIRYSDDACDAVKRLDGQRFLAGAAPGIPVPGCDAPRCRCGFVHHDDRRRDEDRRNPYTQGFGAGESGQYRRERRSGRDRRSRISG